MRQFDKITITTNRLKRFIKESIDADDFEEKISDAICQKIEKANIIYNVDDVELTNNGGRYGLGVTFSGYDMSDGDASFSIDVYDIEPNEDKIPELIKKVGIEVERYQDGYDVDEEMEMYLNAKRNGLEGVPSARELLRGLEQRKRDMGKLAKVLLR